jgi:hypothetical protein
MSREELLRALEIFAKHCPPEAPEGMCCAWEFSLGSDDEETEVKT